MPNPVELAALQAVVPAAQASMRLYGVPASVTLAQWTLESGWGTTGLARQCNNFFGIKHVQTSLLEPYREFKTTEYIKGVPCVQTAEFVTYATPADSFKAHARLIALSSRYAPAMRNRADVPEFCSQLQVCGYSTSPSYATKLLALIRELNLTQYDKPSPGAAVAKENAG